MRTFHLEMKRFQGSSVINLSMTFCSKPDFIINSLGPRLCTHIIIDGMQLVRVGVAYLNL